jgi:N-methylhydantoinase B
MNGIHVHITNTLNLPSESWENEFPLLIERYGLAPDSGGAGRQRGGSALTRTVRALRDGTIFSSFSDGHKRGADGIDGGLPGGYGQLIRNEGRPDMQRYGSKISHVVLSAGETIRIQTPGGGGFGDPALRPIAAIAADIEDGFISVEAARRDFGDEAVDRSLALLKGRGREAGDA